MRKELSFNNDTDFSEFISQFDVKYLEHQPKNAMTKKVADIDDRIIDCKASQTSLLQQQRQWFACEKMNQEKMKFKKHGERWKRKGKSKKPVV